MAKRRTEKKGTRIDAPHRVNRPRGDAIDRASEHAPHAVVEQVERKVQDQSKATLPAANVADDHGMSPAPTSMLEQEADDAVISASLTAQFDRQAAQLAEALDQRAQQLDRREAELNARAAELEQALRTARLWAQEQERELRDRETELNARQQHIEQRDDALANQTQQLQRREAELNRRADELERLNEQLTAREAAYQAGLAALEKQRCQWQNTLRRERQKLDTRRVASLKLVRMLMAGVERRRAIVERQAARLARGKPVDESGDLIRFEERLQDWECRLGEQEAQLAASLEQLAVQQRQLRDQREAFERQRTDWWRRQRAEQRKMRSAERERRELLQRRREQLDRREAALFRLRDDLAATHRRTLELRLVAEELWSRLIQTVPSSKLIRSLGEVRQRLNDQFRFAAEALTEKQREIETLHRQLETAAQDFLQQRQTILQWFARRQKELREEAAQIDTQRRQLIEQRNQLESEREAWQQERSQLEAELLRLKSRQRFRSVLGAGATEPAIG